MLRENFLIHRQAGRHRHSDSVLVLSHILIPLPVSWFAPPRGGNINYHLLSELITFKEAPATAANNRTNGPAINQITSRVCVSPRADDDPTLIIKINVFRGAELEIYGSSSQPPPPCAFIIQ